MTLRPSRENPLDAILSSERLEHATSAPPVESFKPWHLPRKQHIRKAQWGREVARLLEDLRDRQVINYLCLPGEDLLDVQVLADVCKRDGRRLRYLGFDSEYVPEKPSTQRIASEQILRQTDVVLDTSQVVPDNFTSIVRTRSLGHRSLRDGGSYDVVNLDMCDAFTTRECSPTHMAVLELVTLQCNRRAEPWLLFITTRSELARFSDGEKRSYDASIVSNAEGSDPFRRHLALIAGADESLDLRSLLRLIRGRMNADTELSGRWIAIGIGKWLLGLAAQNDPWRVDLLSVYSYRSGLLSEWGKAYADQPPNLFSLVFRFGKMRRNRTDRSGLADGSISRYPELDETQLAVKMARCVERNTADLDCLMQIGAAKHDRLLSECESLLSVRYYSQEAYHHWVDGIPKVTCREGEGR